MMQARRLQRLSPQNLWSMKSRNSLGSDSVPNLGYTTIREKKILQVNFLEI